MAKKIAIALLVATQGFATSVSAQEAKYVAVGDEITATIGCTAEGHAVMTSPDVTASREATSQAMARLRANDQCIGIPGRRFEVLEIAAPVFVERLGKNLYGLRFNVDGRDLWAAHYEVVFDDE